MMFWFIYYSPASGSQESCSSLLSREREKEEYRDGAGQGEGGPDLFWNRLSGQGNARRATDRTGARIQV